MSIEKSKKEALMREFGQRPNDTGSPEVQCALFTTHIKNLTEHFKANPKDFQARRGLLVMVNQRKRLLNYLKGRDKKRHKALIEKLGLRK